MNCGYWGDWYTHVFSKGFILDETDLAEIDMRWSVPIEITERSAAGVAHYIENLKEQGAAQFNESRVLILGEKGSGKTSLALRLANPECDMPNAEASTEGVDIIDWWFPAILGQTSSEVKVHIWDFAGHVITHAAHRCFMSERCLYILLINSRTEGDTRIEYWLEQILNYGGNSPILIRVNIRDEHNVDLQENKLKEEFPSIIGFYYVDIKTGGKRFEAFRNNVIKIVRDNPLWQNQKIPASVFKVKEALQQRFEQGNEFIGREELEQIAENNGIFAEKQKQLLENLRVLGICLWYDDEDMREFNEMVLNPGWISHGIYRLINCGMNNKKHILSNCSASIW